MQFIPSKVKGHDFSLIDLEDKLKPLGYDIGGNWDYEHGSFDYKMDVHNGYYYLRIPFHAIEGSLDYKGAIVQVDTPFILHHIYRMETESDVHISPVNATINQFQTPVEKDADVEPAYIEEGGRLVNMLEKVLLNDEK